MTLPVSDCVIRLVDQIASVYFTIDRKMQVRHPSQVLAKHLQLPAETDLSTWQGGFYDLFKVTRPARLDTFDGVRQLLNSMVLLVTTTRQFAVRGQFVQHEQLPDQFMFIGSPWLAWITAKAPNTAIMMGDFKPWDPQLDQLVLISTERQNLEDLQQLTEELKEARDKVERSSQIQADFFAIMSHEMRTPLNGVITALDLIDTGQLTPQARHMVEVSRASADNLKSVVNHVLDYTRLQTDSFENNEVEPFDFRQLLENTIHIVSTKAEQHNTAITVHLDPDFPEVVAADASKIRQVLLNLLSNAVKFTVNGNVQVNARVRGGELQTNVIDSGVGIPREHQSKIFEPFLTFRPLESHEDSIGLGLNIARRLVEIMGGAIGFSSSPGQGSHFHFTIPIERADTLATASSAPRLNTLHQYQGRVLLAEDNKINQYLIKQVMEKFGLTVDLADNGKQAIAMTNSNHYDVVFMDVSMPIMDGVSAAKLLRHSFSKEELPIVALTAHAGGDYHQLFIDSGMDVVLTKPIDKSALDAILSEHLEPSTAMQKTYQKNQIMTSGEENHMFDNAIANEMLEDIGKDAFLRVATLFQTEIEGGIGKIDDAYQVKDLQLMAELSHRIRSTARSIGCLGLGDILETIENQCRAGDSTELTERLAALPVTATDAFKALDEFKAQL